MRVKNYITKLNGENKNIYRFKNALTVLSFNCLNVDVILMGVDLQDTVVVVKKIINVENH